MSIEDQLGALLGEKTPKSISENSALGAGLIDGYDLFDSPVGEIVVSFNPYGVSSVGLAEGAVEDRFLEQFGRPLVRAEAPKDWGHLISERIEAGSPGKMPVDLRSVTSFQQSVLMEAATIPRGEVRPYGWLAKQVGNPGAARAVGSTMARNPVPLIIPCHRVVRSDGHIGAYSLGGPDNKWQLLDLEGAKPGDLEQLASKHVRLQGNSSTHIVCHPTCRAIRRSKESNVVGFNDLGSAEKAGYRPCRLCRPG